MERKRVFGQNEIYTLQTYLEYVREGRDQLEIKVAGPDYYDNEMTLELFEEEELLKAFQPPTYVDRATGETKQLGDHEPVISLENLGGHSCMAFYQEAKLIGFHRI